MLCKAGIAFGGVCPYVYLSVQKLKNLLTINWCKLIRICVIEVITFWWHLNLTINLESCFSIFRWRYFDPTCHADISTRYAAIAVGWVHFLRQMSWVSPSCTQQMSWMLELTSVQRFMLKWCRRVTQFNVWLTSVCKKQVICQFVLMRQGTTKDTWRTKNIDFYIQWYNRLSSFVATEICVVSILLRVVLLRGRIASVNCF